MSSLAVQADDKILVGGWFTTLGGQTHNCLGRLNATDPATSSLSRDGSTITWLRGGTSPEAWRTTFDWSSDGLVWIPLGDGIRIAGGWQQTNALVPPNAAIRARGFVTGGECNGSGWFVETAIGVSPPTPPVILSSDSAFGFRTNAFGFTVRGLPGQAIVIEASTNFVTWIPVQTNLVTDLAQFVFRDSHAGAYPHRFYRARVHDGLLPPPAIQTSAGSFVFQRAGFGFAWSAIPGQTVVIEGATNLLDWQPLGTNQVGTGPLSFMDPGATNLPARFYRLRLR